MSTTPIQLPALEPPKYYSPLDARAKLANLQNLALQQQEGQQNLQLGQMKLAEGQRQVTEGQQIRDVFRNAPDLRSALPEVYKINPTVGMAMTKSLHDQEKSAIDMETSRIANSGKKAERLASLAGSANDEDSYHRAITKALDEGLMSAQEAQEHLAKGWGPQSQSEMQQATQMGLSAKEQADQRLAKLKEDREALDAKHRQELAGINTLQKQIEITVQTMPVPDPQTGAIDPQEWTKWRAEAPPAVQAKIPPQPSPVAIALMKRMGLTPDQQRQADQSAATLAETKYGKSTPYPPAVQAQKVEEAGAMAGARTNVLQTPQKIAQDIEIAGETAKAVAQAKGPEKGTPAEKKSLAYWERGKFAADSIAPLEAGIANKNLAQQAWLQFMPNASQSEKDQKYRQAQRQFTESHLRPESGAAISASEYENDAKIYFAQPGDTPGTLKQKRAARAVILEGLKTEAGAAYEQKYGKQPPKAGGGGGTPPLIKTQQEYDNLPSGALYTESNGKTYRKP